MKHLSSTVHIHLLLSFTCCSVVSVLRLCRKDVEQTNMMSCVILGMTECVCARACASLCALAPVCVRVRLCMYVRVASGFCGLCKGFAQL